MNSYGLPYVTGLDQQFVPDMRPVFAESTQGRVYGWRRSHPGLFRELADTSGLTVLTAVDPTVDMPPIGDQGQLGACTAGATSRQFQGDAIRDGHDCGPLARLWVYYFERWLEGTLKYGDCGAFGHDAFIVAQHGIPPETLWPYDPQTFQGPVPQTCKPVSSRAYWLKKPVKRVAPNDVAAVKAILSNGQKIAVGFTVYESFESGAVASTGIVPMPQPGEKVLGGHEVLISGYDEQPQHLICDNDWGAEWGHNGRMYMPISYILNPTYADDWRTIQRPSGK